MSSNPPTLRWGIIATGMISSWFVKDLTIDRPDKKAIHIIQAIGSSSLQKGQDFVKKHIPGQNPTVYEGYEKVYQDPVVDIIYIGTPHAFHKQNALDAIRANKHVLVEKPFTINAAEAKEVLAEAEKQGVFVMEAMWTRFFPLVEKIRWLIHEAKVIGDVQRVLCDFAKISSAQSLPPTSRHRNKALGAGTLLDIGIYSLTWALLGLEPEIGKEAPTIKASQTVSDGIDVATSVILTYSDGRQGIATSSALAHMRAPGARIDGTKGTILVDGYAPSVPASFTLKVIDHEPEKFEPKKPGMGFYFEADAVALDIAAGRTQSTVMPWSETLRVLEMMDEVRRQGGARFPQDDQDGD